MGRPPRGKNQVSWITHGIMIAAGLSRRKHEFDSRRGHQRFQCLSRWYVFGVKYSANILVRTRAAFAGPLLMVALYPSPWCRRGAINGRIAPAVLDQNTPFRPGARHVGSRRKLPLELKRNRSDGQARKSLDPHRHLRNRHPTAMDFCRASAEPPSQGSMIPTWRRKAARRNRARNVQHFRP